MTQTLLVSAGEARKLRLEPQTLLTITSLSGGQVADLIVYDAEDLTEYLSPAQTRAALMSIRLAVGDAIYSNRGRALLHLIADSCGVHDMLAPACDEFRYSVDFGVAGHKSCVENFAALLAEHGITRHQLPDPLNVFEAVPVAVDGALGIVPSPVVPGGSATFQAERDCIVCVSACPQDLAPTNHYRATDLQLEISPSA
jgi:uncharacterized protein YcgI (DUF1989 family)